MKVLSRLVSGTKMAAKHPLVSLIIPTLYRQPLLLRRCLESLGKLSFADPWEVIVVENGCHVPRQDFQDTPYTLRWVSLASNQGFASAVNAGIQASEAELLALLNDDTQVDRHWLQQLVDVQKESQADMVASTIYLADKKTLDSQGFTFAWRGKAEALKKDRSSLTNYSDHWLQQPELLLSSQPNPIFWQEPFGPDAAACLYTRHLFTTVGLFRDDFFAYLEDVELSLRARKAGLRCVLASKAVVFHHKHATSQTFTRFKVTRDLINWWKIVASYSTATWWRFGPLILAERLRNLKGYLQHYVLR